MSSSLCYYVAPSSSIYHLDQRIAVPILGLRKKNRSQSHQRDKVAHLYNEDMLLAHELIHRLDFVRHIERITGTTAR